MAREYQEIIVSFETSQGEMDDHDMERLALLSKLVSQGWKMNQMFSNGSRSLAFELFREIESEAQ